MVFSSVIFIFAFLPVCLFGYYGIFRKSRKWQNYFLVACSLLFYSWGGVKYTLLIVLSVLINWLLALIIKQKKQSGKTGQVKTALVAAVVFNVAVLFIFKYLNFTVSNLNLFLKSEIAVPEIALPIGISFFTFQGLSYVIDVYRGHGTALKNPLNVALYISFFPQLIAGPIVRYETIAEQIYSRKESFSLFNRGIRRFIIGLGKKAVLANTLAIIAKQVFSQYYSASALSAWLGAIAFTLQIYYDFSGYSDMAIGLGSMFGFSFEENFDHPYISASITEFWRRWHISLGTWFRDYVYFPLGGSRVKSRTREYFNLLVVWFLTGMWHGANWTFIIWGLFNFVIILLERITKVAKSGNRGIRAFGHCYSLVAIIVGWVFFNSATLGDSIQYLKSMFCIGVPLVDPYFFFSIKENALVLIVSLVCCFPIISLLKKRIPQTIQSRTAFRSSAYIALALILVLSVSYVVKSAYNPFIYFNF